MRPPRPGCGGLLAEAQLLSVLDGGPAFVRAETVRVLEAADLQDSLGMAGREGNFG